MRIQPLVNDPQPACRLVSEAFGAGVTIRGLSAADMRWLLGYPGGKPFAWQALRRRGQIQVALDADPGNGGAGTTQKDAIDLPDGLVLIGTGLPALLEVREGHECTDDRFARSLNLALSQQWARAGLMMVHGAGMVLADSGALILGPKASGKSTLTAAVLAEGGRAVSDDWMLAGFDSEGQARMERTRGFLMLRSSWATERLLSSHAGLAFRTQGKRPKHMLAADPEDSRFPISNRVDHIVLLQRPSSRPQQSQRNPAPPQQALAALIAAGMPLLFSDRFPEERHNLTVLANSMLSGLPIDSLVCGLDIPTGRVDLAALLRPASTRRRLDSARCAERQPPHGVVDVEEQ